MSENIRNRAHVYRMYPTPEQAERLSSWVGAIRFVYNLALEQRRTYWKPGRRLDSVTQGRELRALRREADWLSDVPRDCLDQALRDLDAAHRAWWAGNAGAPTMRTRGVNDCIRFRPTYAGVRRVGRKMGRLALPKMEEVPIRWDGPIPGELRSVTVSLRAGKWFASVAYRVEIEQQAAPELPTVGVDRGIVAFAALSSGELIVGPHAGRQAAISLTRAQRRLSRKQRGSKNYEKQRARVARLHARATDIRKDFLHKTSTSIAKSHSLVVMEDLKVKNMTASAAGTIAAPGRNVRQKAGLNRSILDQGWGTFRLMLAYKLGERGASMALINPAYTSRTCSACGVIDADSRDKQRFSCRSCGHEAHADTNAAINILRRGTPFLPVEAAFAVAEAGTTSEVAP